MTKAPKRPVECPNCLGTGSAGWEQCDECGGTGLANYGHEEDAAIAYERKKGKTK